MNKFISNMRLFAIISVLSVGFANASLTEKETQFLDNMQGKIQSYVVESTRIAHDFLDMRNNESLAKYTSRFKEMVVSCEDEVLNPLLSEKKTVSNNEYGQAINLTHEIVSTLHKQAKHLLSIFEKHRKNPNLFALANDLRPTEKYIQPEAISGVQSQLRKLQGIFSKIYQSLAEKITIIIDSLEQRKDKKMTMIEKFNALKYRVSCR